MVRGPYQGGRSGILIFELEEDCGSIAQGEYENCLQEQGDRDPQNSHRISQNNLSLKAEEQYQGQKQGTDSNGCQYVQKLFLKPGFALMADDPFSRKVASHQGERNVDANGQQQGLPGNGKLPHTKQEAAQHAV